MDGTCVWLRVGLASKREVGRVSARGHALHLWAGVCETALTFFFCSVK